MADTKPIVLSEDDVGDFNRALSLIWIGSSVEDADGSCDAGVHLKNLCDVASALLCNIRNRHADSDQIEMAP